MGRGIQSLEQAYNIFFTGVLIVLAVLIVLCLIRAIIGPKIADRIVSVNMMGTMVIVTIAILALLLGEGYLADICIIYAMISFLAVIVLTKVYTGVYLEKREKERKIVQERITGDQETGERKSENQKAEGQKARIQKAKGQETVGQETKGQKTKDKKIKGQETEGPEPEDLKIEDKMTENRMTEDKITQEIMVQGNSTTAKTGEEALQNGSI